MHRLLIGTCVLALAVVAVRAADDTKPQKPKQVWDELLQKYRAAKTQEERTNVLETYATKLLEYAEKNAKSPDAVEALGIIIQRFPPNMKSKPQAKALASMKKDFLENKDANKTARGEAWGFFMGMQDKIVIGSGSSPKAIVDAKKEMARLRKFGKDELDGQVKDVFIGGVLPELKSKDLNDKDVKTSDLKGKVVMLDVWATWCPPCRAMIPHSRSTVEKLKDKPFVLVGISVDAKKETLTEFMKSNEMPWTHWWSGAAGGIAADLHVGAYPTIFLVDTKGVIRHKYEGSPGGEVLDREIEALLKEAEDKTKSKSS